MQGIRTPFESLKPLAIVGTVFLSPGEFVIVFCDVGPTAAAAEAFSDGIIFFSEKALFVNRFVFFNFGFLDEVDCCQGIGQTDVRNRLEHGDQECFFVIAGREDIAFLTLLP